MVFSQWIKFVWSLFFSNHDVFFSIFFGNNHGRFCILHGPAYIFLLILWICVLRIANIESYAKCHLMSPVSRLEPSTWDIRWLHMVSRVHSLNRSDPPSNRK